MEGKDITESILSEARKRAEEIVSAAIESKDLALEQAKEILEAKRAQVLQAAETECKQIIDRRIMLAKLDAGKAVLGEKQRLIESVYSKAAESIVGLDEKSYCEFIAGLIVEYADDGDEVIICARDKKRLSPAWLNSVSKTSGKGLTFSDETHSDVGGIILRGRNYDKRLTLSALMEEVRAKTESEVISVLFG